MDLDKRGEMNAGYLINNFLELNDLALRAGFSSLWEYVEQGEFWQTDIKQLRRQLKDEIEHKSSSQLVALS